MNTTLTIIPTPGPARSLDFDGDELVDWCDGGQRYAMDGRITYRKVLFSYEFDATAVSPSRRHIVLYKKLATKGLVITRELKLVREINRSFYHANAYEFPVALIRLFDGREALVHCPRDYNQLELEQIEAPISVASSNPSDRKSPDFFHSRLAANPSGTRLISAGWVWHPWDSVEMFDLRSAADDITALDRGQHGFGAGVELTSAAFQGDDSLIFWCAPDGVDFDEDEPNANAPDRFRPGTIASYDLTTQKLTSVAPLAVPAGRLMPVGPDHVVGFSSHPRLIHISTGRIEQEWPEIVCGQHASSIIWHQPTAPPLAIDVERRRFAVGSAKVIHVVQFG